MGEQPRPPTAQAAVQPTKAETLGRLRGLKRRIAVATVLAFGGASALAASHHVGSPAPQAAAGGAVGTPVQEGGDEGFFNQGGSNGQQGYGFGAGAAPQPPVARTGVS
jgi:hypothetical protein